MKEARVKNSDKRIEIDFDFDFDFEEILPKDADDDDTENNALDCEHSRLTVKAQNQPALLLNPAHIHQM